MDLIKINKLKINTIIGVNQNEKQKKQQLVIDVIIHTQTKKAAQTENLNDTIDYAAIPKEIKQKIENNQYNLIETVAEECAQLILLRDSKSKRAIPKIKKVEIIVTKKPMDFKNQLESVSVHIVRK